MERIILKRAANCLLLAILVTFFGAFGAIPKGPSDALMRYGKLPNGFTYYIYKSPVKVISYDFMIKAGWAHEADDQLGLAHLLEHVIALNGSSSFPGGINAFMQKESGGKVKGGANTNLPYTSYYLTIPSQNAELSDRTLKFFREVAHDSEIEKKLRDDKVVDNERGTVLAEFQSHELTWIKTSFEVLGADKGNRLYDPEITETLHNDYINKFKLEPLQRFYDNWYRPEYQALVIAGDLDLMQTEAKIKELFGTLKAGESSTGNEISSPMKVGKVFLKGKNRVLTRLEKNSNGINVDYQLKREIGVIPGVITDTSQFRKKVYGELYNQMAAPRFMQLTHKYNSPFEFVNSTHDYVRPPLAQIEMIKTAFKLLPGASLRQAMKEVIIEMQRIRQYGFSNIELESAKKALLREFLEKAGSVDYFKQSAMEHFVHNGMLPSPDEQKKELVNILKTLSLNEINSFIGDWLSEQKNRDLIISGQEGSASITETELGLLVEESTNAKILPYRPPTIPAKVMKAEYARRLKPATDYKQTEKKSINVTMLKLKNGIELVLKPLVRNTKEQRSITVKGFKPMGYSSFEPSDYFNGTNLGSVMNHMGFGGLNKFELQQFKETKKLDLTLYMAERSSHIQATGPSENLEDILQMLYLQLLYPNNDTTAFGDWFNQEKTTIQNTPGNPLTKVMDSIAFFKGFRYKMDIENLGSVSKNSVLSMYGKVFSKTGDFKFVISGDFEVEKIKPLLIKYFGSLSSVKTSESNVFLTPKVTTVKGGMSEDFYINESDTSLPQSITYLGNHPFDMPERVKMEVLNRMINYTMFKRLTGKEGVYYCTAGANYLEPDIYYVNIGFQSESARVDARVEAVNQEIERLRTKGPDQDELDAAVAAVKTEMESALLSESFWCSYLEQQYLYRGDINDINSKSSLLNAITREDIEMLANQLLVPERRFQYTIKSRSDEQTGYVVPENDKIIESVLAVVPKSTEPDWDQFRQKHGLKDKLRVVQDSILTIVKIRYYKNDLPKFEEAVLSLLKVNKDKLSIYDVNSFGWQLFERSNNMNVLNQAADLFKYNLDHSPPEPDLDMAPIYDTYANLLYKTGQRDSAIKYQLKAYRFLTGKEPLMDPATGRISIGAQKADFLLTALKMEMRTPTWKTIGQNKQILVPLNSQYWKKLKQRLGNFYSGHSADSLVQFSKLRYYMLSKDSAAYASTLVRYAEKVLLYRTLDQKNNDAYEIFNYSSKRKILKRAVAWMQDVVADSSRKSYYGYMDTYANLLYKLGDKDKAIKYSQMALSLAPVAEKEAYQAILDKMINGIPTWSINQNK